MPTVTADTLAALDAFAELDRASREKISKLCTARRYPPSQIVVAHREQSDDVFFIVSGSVRATVYTTRGKEIAYEDLSAGNMFGELSAIDGKSRTTHVITLEESLLVTMKQERFVKLLDSYPAVMKATLKKIAGVVRFLCDRVYEFGALDVNSRIRAELIRLAAGDIANPGRAVVPHMPTHQELANRLATHREAVSRELSRLEKAGLIRKEGHSLVIRDVEGLSDMIADSRPSSE